jgi:hypothetical protein
MSARYYHKFTLVLIYSSLYSCQILIKLELQQILEKSSNIKLDKNPSSRSRAAPHRQTDRQTNGQTDMTKLRGALCNFYACA